MLDPRRNHPADYLDKLDAVPGVDGVLFNKKDQTRIRQCPVDKTGDYAISNSVVGIDNQAFLQCTRLTKVTIPGSVVSIGDKAFHACKGLTGITIPGSVTSIGNNAFHACKSLTSIYFQGNAPVPAASTLGTDKATVYHLPGTTGWGPKFGGCPTAVWKP